MPRYQYSLLVGKCDRVSKYDAYPADVHHGDTYHYYHGEADGVVNTRFTSHVPTAVCFLAVFLLPGYFGCLPRAAHAQILPKPGPDTETVTKPPEQKGKQVKEPIPIPVADIAHAAEETAVKLKLHSTGLDPDPLVEQIEIDFNPVSLN
jgi:hypothetical protein